MKNILFWARNIKVPFGMGHPPTCTSNLVYMCGGGLMGHKSSIGIPVLVLKCFIKHMCFIVLYFHGHAFFLLEIVKKCFIVLYFWKNVLYFCK